MSPCDNCGSAAPDNQYTTVFDGEKHCQLCLPAFTTAMVDEYVEPIVFSLDYEALLQLDKAFGVIHEHLPLYFKRAKMAHVQSVNSTKLSNFPH